MASTMIERRRPRSTSDARVVERMVDAEGADGVVLARRRRAPDLGAVAPGDLRRGDADTAGGGVEQHPLALRRLPNWTSTGEAVP